MFLNNYKLLKSWHLSVAASSFVLGFLLAVQFKSQEKIRSLSANIPSRRLEEMTNLLKESETKKISLEQTLEELKNELLKTKGSNSNLDNYQDSSNLAVEIITGSASLDGSGIIITLDDTKNTSDSTNEEIDALLQNEDLLKITNELYASGAEAISINENRLISNSEISAAGQTIIINKNRVYPPFVIKAIGPVEPMLAALEMKGGVMEYIKFFGIAVKIEKNKKIKIPAYEEGLNFQFAKPVP